MHDVDKKIWRVVYDPQVYSHIHSNRADEKLQLKRYRAAAFDVTSRKTTEMSPIRYSVSSIRLHGKKVVETQAAWNLLSTTVSTAIVAQLPCQLD